MKSQKTEVLALGGGKNVGGEWQLLATLASGNRVKAEWDWVKSQYSKVQHNLAQTISSKLEKMRCPRVKVEVSVDIVY